jgi:hypothetical protein
MDLAQLAASVGFGIAIALVILVIFQSKTSFFDIKAAPLDGEAVESRVYQAVGAPPPKPVQYGGSTRDITNPPPISEPNSIVRSAPISQENTTMMPPVLTPAPMSSNDMMPLPQPMMDAKPIMGSPQTMMGTPIDTKQMMPPLPNQTMMTSPQTMMGPPMDAKPIMGSPQTMMGTPIDTKQMMPPLPNQTMTGPPQPITGRPMDSKSMIPSPQTMMGPPMDAKPIMA